MNSTLSFKLEQKTNQALSSQCRGFFGRANALSIMEAALDESLNRKTTFPYKKDAAPSRLHL
jgi:hypothetical protein